jgi:hypothetical protein
MGLLTKVIGNPERTAPFLGWEPAGKIAMVTKETTGMLAPEIFTQ